MTSKLVGTLLVVSLFGCGSKDPPAVTSPDGDAGADAAAAPCTEPLSQRPDAASARCLITVTGAFVDAETGAGIAGLSATVCGRTCYYAEKKTDAQGRFEVNVGRHVLLEALAVIAHGRPNYATLFVKLPTTTANDSIEMPAPIKLVKLPTASTPLPADNAPASTVTAGDLTFNVPAATEFLLDIEDDPVTDRKLRSVKVDAANYPPFTQGQNLKALYALTPFECEVSKPIGLSMANPDPATLKAGDAVEFVVLGSEFVEQPPTAGLPLVGATGKVSSDGTKVETDAGQGLRRLTWVGVRKKP